jgi:hypothetical protein
VSLISFSTVILLTIIVFILLKYKDLLLFKKEQFERTDYLPKVLLLGQKLILDSLGNLPILFHVNDVVAPPTPTSLAYL